MISAPNSHDHPILKVSRHRYYLTVAAWLFILIPLAVYFYLVNKYAVNIPSQDDYDAILGFLLKFRSVHGFEKLAISLSQHNEHRILSSRIVYILYYYIFGNINFRNIIFIGNLQLALIFIISVLLIKRILPGYWVIAGFVTGLCLFDPNGWENADFAMASMQNYGVIFLCTSSLYLYSLHSKKFVFAAAVLQIICIYSSGNGIVASFFIALSTVLMKDQRKMIIGIAVVLIFSPLYFLHYNFPPPSSQPKNIINIATYFFHLAGAHIYYESMTPSVITGIILLIVFAYAVPVNKGLRVRYDAVPLVCLSGFLFSSLGTIALFRSNIGGPAYCSRYLVYPHFIFALTFIFLLLKWEKKKWLWLFAIIVTWRMIPVYQTNKHGGIDGFEFLNKTLTTTDYYYPDKNGAKAIADKACQLHIYCIEQERNKIK